MRLRLALLLLSTFLKLGCTHNTHTNVVRIKLQTQDLGGKKAIIGPLNMINFEKNILSEHTIDSLGNCMFEFDLNRPMFLDLGIDNHVRGTLLVSPGDDMSLSVDELGHFSFTGIGSEPNNYLTQINSIQSRIKQAGRINIHEMKPEDFLQRLDSLTIALSSYHEQFSDTTKLPAGMVDLLYRKNTINSTMIKLNYSWNYGATHNFEIPKHLDALDEVLFDSILMNTSDSEYASVLHFYMNLKYYFLPNLERTEAELESFRGQMPVAIRDSIKTQKYPLFIEEFLEAKNVDYWLTLQGITPSSEIIRKSFKKEFPGSSVLPILEKRYNKWLSISKGQPAPNFEGQTPAGEKLSLKDLSGRVVYVDVWATWCKPCIAEFPAAKKLQKRFENSKVVFLFVSVDRNEDSWRKMLHEDPDFKGTHIIEPKDVEVSIWKSYLISGIPRYILIDKEGLIVSADASRPSSAEIDKQIEKLLE